MKNREEGGRIEVESASRELGNKRIAFVSFFLNSTTTDTIKRIDDNTTQFIYVNYILYSSFLNQTILMRLLLAKIITSSTSCLRRASI